MRLPLVLLPLILAACSLEPVRRNIELTPHVALPEGFVMLGGDGAMLVELGEIEALGPDHAYVAWASTATDSVYLGTVSAEAPLGLRGSDFGLGAADIEQLRITIEDRASLPIDAPSAPPVLEATLTPGSSVTLSIPRLDDASLAEATASAVLEDAHIEVTSVGLPVLPSALFYGAWLEFDAEEGAGTTPSDPHVEHAHTGHDPAASEGPAAQTRFAGALDPAGALSIDLGVFVGRARAMTICVEADHGVEARSPTCVLRGAVVMPSGAAVTAPAEHVH